MITVAQAIALYRHKIKEPVPPSFTSEPAARVAIIEGRVNLNGRRIEPLTVKDTVENRLRRAPDYPLPGPGAVSIIEVYDMSTQSWTRFNAWQAAGHLAVS